MADTMARPQAQALQDQAPSEAGEPSMEDILASIRRIIASDQGVGAARQAAVARTTPEPLAHARPVRESRSTAEEPLETAERPGEMPPLTDLDALVFPPVPIESEPPEALMTVDRAEARTQLHGSLFPPAEDIAPLDDIYDLQAEQLVSPSEAEPLISSAVGASVTSSFQSLADSMLMRDPEMLERIARDALRPMLKSWLDDNLPSMVERLVRAEIERVARGGRSRG